MARQSESEEVVTIHYQKHSMWTQFKIVAFWNCMVAMGVGFAWIILNMNMAMAKASGFVGEIIYLFGN